tara:strand:+ start:194 stop:715 length:522 start_codon:yes stop_codon:yes gene_type:complete
MTTKQKKKKIQEAHDVADKALKAAQKLYTPTLAQRAKDWLYTPLTLSYGQFAIVVLFCVVLLALSSGANASCAYTKDAWGNTKYNCDSGQNGTLRTDAWGNTKDTGTGLTYRKDAWGNTRSSDGTIYRTDAWGNTRGSDGTTARKDAWGNTVITNGSSTTKCSTNAWGTIHCN